MANLEKVNTSAGDARMHVNVAPRFDTLRETVHAASGVDFLAICGDVLRSPDFRSSKAGVAMRSWHKTGRAFDYDQNSRALVIVGEAISGKQFFRTYLICQPQDGSLGELKKLKDYRGYVVSKYVVDFTQLAENAGFHRIPAWAGWRKSYNTREFWHYQRDEGLTWDAAMQQILRGDQSAASLKTAVVAGKKIIGLNDRDSNTAGRVTLIQQALNRAGLLASKQIDGVYGKYTSAAVKAFQRSHGLSGDGTVGPLTAAALKL